MLLTLVLGCGAGAMATTAPALSPDAASPDWFTIQICAAIDLGDFSGPGQTLHAFTFDSELEPSLRLTLDPPDSDRAPLGANVNGGKPWVRGPEPPAAALALSGVVFIALSKWRRRRSGASRRCQRRRVYTIRQMA
jgi:hypothetical protein